MLQFVVLLTSIISLVQLLRLNEDFESEFLNDIIDEMSEASLLPFSV